MSAILSELFLAGITVVSENFLSVMDFAGPDPLEPSTTIIIKFANRLTPNATNRNKGRHPDFFMRQGEWMKKRKAKMRKAETGPNRLIVFRLKALEKALPSRM
jgi:hypothetical protein